MSGYDVLTALIRECERDGDALFRLPVSKERVIAALNQAITVGLAFDVITAQHSELRLLKAELERSRRAE